MERAAMGRVIVTALVENLGDVLRSHDGDLPVDRVRRIEVADALVDTGLSGFAMPRRLIDQLGLTPLGVRPVRTAAGPQQVRVYAAVRLAIQGRECTVDVTEVPDDCPVLVGQVPLELLDFVIDVKDHCLTGNPAHGGEQMYEMYGFIPPDNER